MEMIYDGVAELAKNRGMAIEESIAYSRELRTKDPAFCKKERYHLTDVSYGWTYFDTVDKKNICFTPREWRKQRKFEAENKNNICTDF